MRDDGPAGAATSGPRVGVLALQGGVAEHERLLREVSISTNTTAAGGNASLMMVG